MSSDPQDETLFGRWLRDHAHLERLPRDRRPIPFRQQIAATLGSAIVIALVAVVVWRLGQRLW